MEKQSECLQQTDRRTHPDVPENEVHDPSAAGGQDP